jgi:hypothetical protein
MRAPAPTVALVAALVALVVLGAGGCSRLEGAAAPGIEERTAVVPEHRSTCEALARVDLAVVGTDDASRERSATALDQAATRAPAEVGPALGSLADAYRRSATAAVDDPGRADVVAWVNASCGGAR